MTRAVVYCRVSSQEQVRGYSLDAQEQECCELARRIGYADVRVVREEGASGSTLDRPALRALLDSLDGVEALVVWRQDRLSRSLRGLLQLVHDEFRPRGIRLISARESIDTETPMGRATMGILGSIAELELETIRERTTLGKRRRAQSGLWQGRVPYGYMLTADSLLVPDPETAPVVREMFARYAAGESMISLARWLGWRGNAVRRVLQRVVYSGRLGWNGETLKGQHEALVSARLYAAVQERLATNGSLAPRQRQSSWSPLYRCGVCGSVMDSATCNARGHQWRLYRCSERQRTAPEDRHRPVTVGQQKANRYLWEAVVAQIEEGTLKRWVEVSRRRARSAEHREREAAVRLRLRELERQIGYNLRAASEGAVDLMVLRGVNGPLLTEQERLRGELETLDVGRSEATDAGKLLRAVPTRLQVLTAVQRRDLLLRLLDRVDVQSSRELVAHWSFPGADPLTITLPARLPRA